jgi:hypothetical protein
MSSKYKILPVKIKNKVSEKWKDVDKRLPIHPFALLIQAPPKSGKTNWLVNQLLNPAFGWLLKFGKVIWISPTIESDKTARPIMDIIHDEDNELGDKIKVFTGDDIDMIDHIIKEAVKQQKEDPEMETLIILDDCIGKMKNGEFGKLYAKYRHNNLSIVGISQTFKSFDVISRASANGYILFRSYNEAEKKKIMEELASFPFIEKHYDECTRDKHNFLWVNVENQELWHNFDRCVWSKDAKQSPPTHAS